MDLPVGNYDIEQPASVLNSAKSPEIRLSTGRLNFEKSLQKSIKSRLQTPKQSKRLSDHSGVGTNSLPVDQNATLDPGPRGSQEHLIDEEEYDLEVIQGGETIQ